MDEHHSEWGGAPPKIYLVSRKMITPIDRLGTFIAFLISKNELDGYYIGQFFSLIRQVIEFEELEDNYQVLNFYCNWCLHPELGRNPGVAKMISKISDSLDKHANGDPGKFVDSVNDAISFRELRNEIIDLLKTHGLEFPILESRSQWKGILNLIFENISDKKLVIQKKYFKNNSVGIPPRAFWLANTNQPGFENAWMVEILSGNKSPILTGRVMFTETREDFKYE
jgi:hypothetical protein